MGRFLFRWITSAVLLIIVAVLVPGVHVSFGGALIAALVLGFFSAIVRPVLIILTFPITIVTLGFFILVINAILFWVAALFVPGFDVHGVVAAFIGALLYAIFTAFVNSATSVGEKSGSTR
ncbi:MAG TPA: phage holin family protein [Chloroflexota bacterium]|nr:phage holin family protein [Chloroflexota bacterium]